MYLNHGFPQWLGGRESTCNTEDMGLVPDSGRYPGEGNNNTLQYSCLGNPTDKGAWQDTVHGVTKDSDMTKWLNKSNIYLTQYFN